MNRYPSASLVHISFSSSLNSNEWVRYASFRYQVHSHDIKLLRELVRQLLQRQLISRLVIVGAAGAAWAVGAAGAAVGLLRLLGLLGLLGLQLLLELLGPPGAVGAARAARAAGAAGAVGSLCGQVSHRGAAGTRGAMLRERLDLVLRAPRGGLSSRHTLEGATPKQ